jgi:hypothetical protein
VRFYKTHLAGLPGRRLSSFRRGAVLGEAGLARALLPRYSRHRGDAEAAYVSIAGSHGHEAILFEAAGEAALVLEGMIRDATQPGSISRRGHHCSRRLESADDPRA